MKLRVLMITVVLAVSFLVTGILYAASGDLIVNGNLGVGTTTPQSKAEINGNVAVSGNLTVQGTITAPNAHVMTKYYGSTEQTIASFGSSTTVAHGLGVKPVLVQVSMVCKTAGHGYSVGDEVIPVSNVLNSSGSFQTTSGVWWNETSIGFITGTYGILIARKDNGDIDLILPSSHWKLIFRAWAF